MNDLIGALQHATGDLWPYLVIVLFGFIPTEIWRVLGVALGKGLSETSEVFHWVRFVATGLVTAVVAKLILVPQGSLATIDVTVRIGALLTGLAVMFLTGRSIVFGLSAGLLALVAAGYWAGS